MSKAYRELVLPAQVENLSAVLSFLEEQLEEASCPMKQVMQITVAAEEVFVNIASYAYEPGSGMAEVRFQLTQDSRTAVVTFIDSGIPFNPLEKEDPNVTLSAAERDIGGLGIFMTKKTMDEVRYERVNGQNVLTLIKHF